METQRLPSGNPDLDGILGGGLEPRVITQFYREPASGKSTLCVVIAVERLRSGRGVVFIDTEGFSIERFRQIAGDTAEKLAERLFLYEPSDFDQQGAMIASADQLCRTRDIGLVVLDSATGLYRTQLGKGRDAMQHLTRQMVLLLGLGKRYDIPIVITNQVYMDTTRNTFIGLGGTALEHISKVIVRVDRVDGFRRATLTKHRSLPAGGYFDFCITSTGISPK
jgi:DNA repair protein RadB